MASNDNSPPSPQSEVRHLSSISVRQNVLISEDPTLIPTPSANTPIPSALHEEAEEKSSSYPGGASPKQPPPPLDDSVKIDLRDHLTPHNDPSNLFAFTPDQLSALMDPKNLPLLYSYGGLDGVAKGLHVDLQTGLVPNTKIQTPVTLNDVMPLSRNAADSPSEPPEPRPRARSMTVLSTATGATRTEPTTAFPQRVNVFGANLLPDVKSKSIFQLMWMAFQDKTLILLTVAAIVSLGVGLYEDIAVPEYDAMGNRIPGVKWVEGVAIIVAVLLVVMVGSVNDFQKERQFRKLNAKKEDRVVKATREGVIGMISVRDVQVGDILHLEPGDIVAVDGVFIEGHNLKCDESAATGESDAVRKQNWETCYRQMQGANNDYAGGSDLKKPAAPAGGEHKANTDPFILSGGKVLEGVCTYLVTCVGTNSYYGRTMMALRSEPESTPLQEKLNYLAEMIAKLGSAVGLLMLIVLLIRYFVTWKDGVPDQATDIVMDIMKILIVVVTIVVVAVPEGLPLAVTLALAYATQRMLKDNNLVRVLAACETMGNATTVCSDKTGTLTQNKMAVVAGTLGCSFRFLKNAPSDRTDLSDISQVAEKVPKQVLNMLNQSIAVNSSAFEGKDENGNDVFVGNKTETALLAFSRDVGSDHYDTIRNNHPVEHAFPFSSERKAMATVVRVPHPDDPKRTIYRVHIKGASEILLQNCNQIVTLQQSNYKSATHDYDVRTRSLTQEDNTRLERIIQSYASRSLRTLGIGYRDFEQWPPQSASSPMPDADGEAAEVPYEDIVHDKGVTLLGIVGIEDPLRDGVTEAVKACQSAGVFVRMVTGDNLVTAKAIAKQCGIYTTGGVVMEGPTFRNLPPAEMDAILPRLQVLARSSPEDKRILVTRLRDLGDIVAVTGDGTNDGPALKSADVGFSMGIAGTEVAKEASSIILMDDNFSSIVKAISWGRCVNDAVKKFLQFQLTVNITAVVTTFLSSVISTNQKSVLTAVQLLWVNLIMDTFAALALATDPPTQELLERAPEPRSAPLITFKMWKMIFGQAIFQIVVTVVLLYSNVLEYDTESPVLQTVVFNTFVFCQIFNEINCRRIDSQLNVFTNIFANKFFVIIFIICVAGQALIVNFGGAAFQVVRIDGIHWAISVLVGLLALPIGVVIRLIPDNLFAFVLFKSTTRERYLGHSQKVPSMYMAGNERMSWSNTYDDVQQGIQSMKHSEETTQPSSKQQGALAASVMLPSLVATAPSTGWVPPDHENENQNTQYSYTSRSFRSND
ncbi:PMCA-type calcium-translocating P-type ATPase [Zychaea mexicana]|uniref:PMCA-type calcium-translocating P-type ATPase n=1 Tax=Zychaea mexicana TaxID=64656 RepID=UPI0022FEE2D6|nr:PMCA-type calcium-translocating P-type ATPase [Zychaea mexicana]KAI9497073.1 PMCA-type calcium-translocating P-type ATPase [Zychaea mexicana]